MDDRYDPRVYLEDEVRNRIGHRNAEDVRSTCSFARAERLLGQEYHGRFLIELLQNAADAFRGVGSASERSHVEIRITDGPALLVANCGAPMDGKVVIESLGHIGASTKAKGEAIGHKGIGFKSVLELSLTPEIYSGLQNSSPTLAVGFDPEKARDMIRADKPEEWDARVGEVHGLDKDDPFAAVPILRYPYWIEDLPPDVAELAERGFDTVVRLPFDERFAGRLKPDADEWLDAVRSSLRDVSDHILLLLGCFDEVRIEDRPARSVEVIKPEWEEDSVEIGGGVSREIVRVMRNGRFSSRWRLFRRALPDRPDLEEIAVGVRIGDGSDTASVLPATGEGASAPFHLFFPTKIQSGLPFLLHAYFEVNAARTGFYHGSQSHNKRMLDELAALAKIAVEDVTTDESLDLASLVNLVAKAGAEAGEPKDEDIGKFRSNVLCHLDEVAWIPLKDGHEGRRSECPERVFAERRDIVRRIGDAFPETYIERRSGLRLPDANLGEAALELVKGRRPDAPGLWEFVGRLCRPGEEPPWDDDSADEKFLRLIELFKTLEGASSPETKKLLDGLRGDSESRLIPTAGEGGSRKFFPVSDPTPGKRGRLVMARVRSSSGRDLVPPHDLGVAFLHDGLLSSEAEVDSAKPLGVRPFTVDIVLDRLGGIEIPQGNEAALVRFLWQFLARERRSGFGTKQSAEQAATFDPSKWFWCAPGSVWHDEARERQQRKRNLASVPLPCRDGEWRKAGQIAFGADWADWLEERTDEHRTAATERRIAAYRAMEKLSPGSEHLLAHPDEVLGLLDDGVFENAGEDEESGEEFDNRRKDAEKHAFLLRLGVWEVPPIEAYESRDPRDRSKFPWPGKIADKQREIVEKNGGWRFGIGKWGGERHHNVYLAEDHRFVWPLEEMAHRDESALVECLRLGAKLYGERSHALVFCPGCANGGGSHRKPHASVEGDGYPSSLAIQLRSEPWVPCTLDGEGGKILTKPEAAWWNPSPPSEAALKQSPWRFVPFCGPEDGVDESLRRLAGLNTFDEAPADAARADAVERLLRDLRKRFENDCFPSGPPTSGVARQAFVSIHRTAYEWLAKHASEDGVAKGVAHRTGVLCELGETLVYRRPDEARHDNGDFASYTHYFAGKIPFAVIPRSDTSVAGALDIPRFRLTLTREGRDDGVDVTDNVREIHADRIPELLAIMTHHSLGTQTLDPSSEQFKTRANRLRNLRIIQLDDLVVNAVAEGSENVVKIGAGSNRDLHLEYRTPSSPILFHDFSDDGWRDRLRQKISPYFATILENPAYSHTFMAFLQSDEAGREEFLHDLGISENDVDAIETGVKAASEEVRQRRLRWFRAILAARGHKPSNLDGENLASELKKSGLPDNVVHRLIEIGGSEEARRQTGEGSALRMLHDAGTDLEKLHEILHDAGDDGLVIRVAKDAFRRWLGDNGRRLSAVLATKHSKHSPESAKKTVGSMKPPSGFEFPLDPELSDLLSPVVEELRKAGFSADAHALAKNPAKELARIGEFDTVEELDAEVEGLLDEGERKRVLRGLASEWRREIQLLAVLANVGDNETPANIRDMDEKVSEKLPHAPSSPAELRDSLGEWFSGHPRLSGGIHESLTESMNATAPNREELIKWAREDGIGDARLDSVKRALDKPKVARVRELKEHVKRLGGMRPVTPGFVPPPSPGDSEDSVPPEGGVPRMPERPDNGGDKPRNVQIGTVGERPDPRKNIGDEGERWALAAMIRDLMALEEEHRAVAINEIEALIRRRFEGGAAKVALGHVENVRKPGLDGEDLIEALSGLLHVSRYSDYFGFDMIGWLSPTPGGKSGAMCLEVKSSADERFHLSPGEWREAERLREEYAVLVVRRAKGVGAPAGMDLLPDPVKLAEAGSLKRKPDGFQMEYKRSDA